MSLIHIYIHYISFVYLFLDLTAEPEGEYDLANLPDWLQRKKLERGESKDPRRKKFLAFVAQAANSYLKDTQAGAYPLKYQYKEKADGKACTTQT